MLKVWTGRVPDHDIDLYLNRYCDILQKLKPVDKFGIWYGVRKYKIRLKKDANGHPVQLPNSVSLGPYNGQIIYPGQTVTCFICQSTEHQVKQCPSVKCWRCGCLDHKTKDCTLEALCNLCGRSGHTFFNCPSSYVNRVKTQLQQSKYPQQSAPPALDQQRQRPAPPEPDQQQQPALRTSHHQLSLQSKSLRSPVQQTHPAPEPDDPRSGEESFSDVNNSYSEGNSSDEEEKNYESSSESPSSDFCLAMLTDGQRVSTPKSTSPQSQLQPSSGSFSPTPEFPDPSTSDLQTDGFQTVNRKKKVRSPSVKREYPSKRPASAADHSREKRRDDKNSPQ